MKVVKFNKDNLTDQDMHETVTRVKVFLINDKGEIIIANSNGGCQLPGEHIEEGEELIDGVIREIKEETGITLKQSEISQPFYEIRHYTKNYKETGKNRISNVLYFFAKTNKVVNESNLNLTEHEKLNAF